MLTLLLACAAPQPDSGGPGAPTPWQWQDSGAAPQWEAAEVQQALEAALPVLRSLDPRAVFETYDDVMGQAETGCPETWESGDRTAWSDDCTTPTGWRFAGRAELAWRTTSSGSTRAAGEGSVHAEITGPEGQRWVGSGDLALSDTVAEEVVAEGEQPREVRRVQARQVGSFSWTEMGPGEPWGWLGQEASLSWAVQAWADDLDRRALVVDGGLAVTGAALTVTAEELAFHSLETGAGCALEPGGSLRIRDAQGDVARVRFDGATSPDQPAALADCDGCGRLDAPGSTDDGAAICLDFSDWLAWEQAPW